MANGQASFKIPSDREAANRRKKQLIGAVPKLDQLIETLRQEATSALIEIRSAASKRLKKARLALRRARDEIAELEDDPSIYAERESAVLEWLNQQTDAPSLAKTVVQDPLTFLAGAPQFSQKQAEIVLQDRRRRPGDVFESLGDITGISRSHLLDLHYTGRDFVAGGGPVTGVQIPLLLPLRLETRFRQDGSTWTLRLLIIPDDPWFDHHDPLASSVELRALEAWHTAIQSEPSGDTPKAVAAWDRFAKQTGGARAAWLVQRFPAVGVDAEGRVIVDRPAEVRTEGRFSSIRSFPRQLTVHIERTGRARTIRRDLTVRPDRLRFELPDPSSPSDQRWWQSFTEAQAAGLGVEIGLGARANNIEAIFVFGVGYDSPTELFRAHRASGRLSVLQPLTPTNTVHGERAGGDRTPNEFWRTSLSARPNIVERELGELLTEDPEALGVLPGSPGEHNGWATALVSALWPALWGHPLKDLLGGDSRIDELSAWAVSALRPFGPYPALRIGRNPYGLLPISPLDQWRPERSDESVEQPLTQILEELSQRWSDAAESDGTVSGADAARLLDLVGRTPTASRLDSRWQYPVTVLILVALINGWRGAGDFVGMWESISTAARGLLESVFGRFEPSRRMFSIGDPRPVNLPAVVPTTTRVSEALTKLADIFHRDRTAYAYPERLAAQFGGALPDSLFVRLLIRSLQVALADVGREMLRESGPTLENLAFGYLEADRLTRMQRWILAAQDAQLDDNSPLVSILRRILEGLEVLAVIPDDALEALFLSTVDCATSRIDAWTMALANRRLRRSLRGGRGHPDIRVGAYGWVDGPRPRDSVLADSLLLAPSDAHALTASVIRDRFLQDPSGRWNVGLDSLAVQQARRLAAAVRQGIHPGEFLGHEVERAVIDPVSIERLRRTFPFESSSSGKRVCDGRRVLAAPADSLGIASAALARLEPLRHLFDDYGDLLIAEAVYRVVEGRGDRARTALEAAAGLGPPPEHETLRPVSQARTVHTTCITVLPSVDAPSLPPSEASRAHLRPIQFVDPSVASLVDLSFATAGNWSWTVERSEGARTVTIADLSISVADTLALSAKQLEAMVSLQEGDLPASITARRGTELRNSLGRWVRSLGHRQATAADLLADSPASVPEGDTRDLLLRIGNLESIAEALENELRRFNTSRPVEPAALTRLRAATRRWGIPVPLSYRDDEDTDWARRAAEQLLERRSALPPVAERGSMPLPDLIDVLQKLSAPQGDIAVLGELDPSDFPTLSRSPTIAAGLEELALDWLSATGAARPNVGRLEASILESGSRVSLVPRLHLWANRPSDPWQTRTEDTRPLLVAAAPDAVSLTAPVTMRLAGAVVDRWAEGIPAAQRTIAAAFRFDAPAARAPQAILISVPPDLDRPMDLDTVLACVREARRQTRVRAATPRSPGLEDLAVLLPPLSVPIAGPTGVSLNDDRF